MTKDIQKYFIKRWPVWFTNVEYGFFLPAGWKYVLTQICYRLDNLLARFKVPQSTVAIMQVKEKHGGLCFYTDVSETPHLSVEKRNILINKVANLSLKAEEASSFVCASCASTKGMYIPYQRLCSSCEAELKAEI